MTYFQFRGGACSRIRMTSKTLTDLTRLVLGRGAS